MVIEYDKSEMFDSDDGKISVLMKQLYDACEEEGIVMSCTVLMKVLDDDEKTVGISRGMLVTRDGWIPDSWKVMEELRLDDSLMKVIMQTMPALQAIKNVHDIEEKSEATKQ